MSLQRERRTVNWQNVISIFVGAAPIVAILSAPLIFPVRHSHLPQSVPFLALYFCVGCLLLGFFGGLILAVKRRKVAWLIVVIGSVASMLASWSIAFKGFNFGH